MDRNSFQRLDITDEALIEKVWSLMQHQDPAATREDAIALLAFTQHAGQEIADHVSEVDFLASYEEFKKQREKS